MNNQPKGSPSLINEDAAQGLLKKWKPMINYSSDNVAPITDDHTRLATAMVLENQEKWCREQGMLTEANLAQAGGVFGTNSGSHGGSVPGTSDFYATGDSRLPKVLIPMIRRTFPELITNEIVGVQPMSGPVGLAFALRYRYESDALADYTSDGNSTLNSASPRPWRDAVDGEEAGFNKLDTRFTGTSSAQLSGHSEFTMLAEDMGVAELLENFELSSNIPQMTVEFDKTSVEAGTRRLAAKWSVELEQDIKNMNGIDIDNELINAMSYEIQAEIDREMIIRMIQIALSAGAGAGFSIWTAGSADARWLGERNRDFYAKIVVESNRLAIRNRRGSANFLVATPRVCAMLEMLPEFQFMQVQGNVNVHPTGIACVGSIGGRYNVYRDTRTEAQVQGGRRAALEYCLLGYKGTEFFDTGIIYAPYIPVMVQRTIGPNDFSPRVGLLTRYGVVDNIFGAELYYHVIIVKGLGESFVPGATSVYL